MLIKCNTVKVLSLVICLSVMYLWWSFLEPSKYLIGSLIFSLITIRNAIGFIKTIGKWELVVSYDYKRLTEEVLWIVALVAYQVLVK